MFIITNNKVNKMKTKELPELFENKYKIKNDGKLRILQKTIH